MRPALAALATALLAACTTVSAPAGTAVALGRRVQLGDVVVTPMQVIEDSRCPAGVRCVWAGRLMVRTRIEVAGWREVADLGLGQAHATHGRTVTLASAAPDRTTDRTTPPQAYRFVYLAR